MKVCEKRKRKGVIFKRISISQIFTETDDTLAPLKSDAQLIRIIQDAKGQVDIYLQYSKN